MSIERRLDKEDVDLWTGILFSHQKEGSPAVCDKRKGFQGHYAKWDKTEKANAIWFHLYVKFKKKLNSENRLVVARGKEYRLEEMGEGCQKVHTSSN